MKSHLAFFLALAAALSTPALTQTTEQTTEQPAASSSPVAFVYVSRPSHIDGFAVSSSGALTPVPGSPISAIVASMSVNKKYLFATDGNGYDIDTFSIATSGALKLVKTTNAQVHNNSDCTVGLEPLAIDVAGTTLYTEFFDCDGNGYYESFHIESNGDLQFLGFTKQLYDFTSPLRVAGNDKYVYATGCFDFDEDGPFPSTATFKRDSNGMLTYENSDTTLPPTKSSANYYCPSLMAADPNDHIVIALQTFDTDEDETEGSVSLATYTVGSNGKLTTKSTYENMADTGQTSGVNAISISPSGKLIAVAGDGFQLFHFNGSAPITPYTKLFDPNVIFTGFAWDSDNHLFVLGNGGLSVYSATSTSFKQEGPTYSIPEAGFVIVRSLK